MTTFAGHFGTNERIVSFPDDVFQITLENLMTWLDANLPTGDAAVLARMRAIFAGGPGENETLEWYAETLVGHTTARGAPYKAFNRLIGILVDAGVTL